MTPVAEFRANLAQFDKALAAFVSGVLNYTETPALEAALGTSVSRLKQSSGPAIQVDKTIHAQFALALNQARQARISLRNRPSKPLAPLPPIVSEDWTQVQALLQAVVFATTKFTALRLDSDYSTFIADCAAIHQLLPHVNAIVLKGRLTRAEADHVANVTIAFAKQASRASFQMHKAAEHATARAAEAKQETTRNTIGVHKQLKDIMLEQQRVRTRIHPPVVQDSLAAWITERPWTAYGVMWGLGFCVFMVSSAFGLPGIIGAGLGVFAMKLFFKHLLKPNIATTQWNTPAWS